MKDKKEGRCPFCNTDLVLDDRERTGKVKVECGACKKMFELNELKFNSNIIKSLHGYNGNLFLYNNKILITRNRGCLNMFTLGAGKGDKTIYIEQISGIQIKKPRSTTGFIQFVVMGSSESKGNVFDAISDENTVTFKAKKGYIIAEEIREEIEKIKAEKDKPREVIQISSVADELLKLKKLVDEGVLSNEEFLEEKKKVLNK